MTIHDLASHLHHLSIGGYFNGEKFSTNQLENYISGMFRTGTSLKGGNHLVMEIALADGRWFFTINRYSQKPDGFDYEIPENRDQEAKILALIS